MSQNILIGVTGGIAAYKTAALVSDLVQSGFGVRVAMTKNASNFVGVDTFAALTGHAVAMDSYQSDQYPLGAHIELTRWANVFCVAPATANFIAKAALGIADDLLSTMYLAYSGPVLFAPAMNNDMWQKPSVQRNIETIKSDGVHLIGPDSGWLSCREQGAGRMASPDAISERIKSWPES